MRLIDAHALDEKISKENYLYVTKEDFQSWLAEAPTIEAIPVSFIKSYALSTGKAILPFNALINEWRRINGKQ